MVVGGRNRDMRSTGAESFALLMLLDGNSGFFANRVGIRYEGEPDRRKRSGRQVRLDAVAVFRRMGVRGDFRPDQPT